MSDYQFEVFINSFSLLLGQASSSSRAVSRQSTKLLVKNLPNTADEEFLEMFFEHTKRQGGGPVKHIKLYKEGSNFAIIEFEKPESVDEVMKKVPIKMQGETVEVEKYAPYLERDESLESIGFYEIPKQLVKDIGDMKITDLKRSASGSSRQSFTIPMIDKAKQTHPGVGCSGCGLKTIIGSRFYCNNCFPDFNFCFNCKSDKPHNPSHTFTKLEAGNYPSDFIHAGFWCDGCRVKPIQGARFRCKNCPSFDYCALCIAKKAWKEHDPLHTFIKL